MDLGKARALVAAAISNGLEYSSYSRLDSPEESFNKLFAEVDQHLSEGLTVVAWWQAVRLYRPSSFSNEVAVAVTTVAEADLGGLVEALHLVKASRLMYELTSFALFQAPQARYVEWLKLAQTQPLLGLGVACALRSLVETHAKPDQEHAIDGWATSLRSKSCEARSSIWWQLAALGSMTGPMRDWSAVAEALWGAASREIEIGEEGPQAHAALIAKL